MTIRNTRAAQRCATGFLALFLIAGLAAPAPADPPPWAPAHGYRDKGKGKGKGKGRGHGRHGRDRAVVYTAPPVGIPQGTCYRERVGNMLGGAAGGYLGSHIGSGSGQKAATAAGAVIGWIVGGEIGRAMDQVDQACVGQALEQAEESAPVRWVDPDNRVQYRVVPTKTYERDGGQYCREFTAEATIGGRVQTVYGTACRQPDGSWKRVS